MRGLGADPKFGLVIVSCVFLFLSVKLLDSAVSDFRFGSHAKWPCICVASQIDSFWFRV